NRPRAQSAGNAEGGRDPDGRGGRQAFDRPGPGVAQNHPGADKADAGHDTLHDTLNHAAQRIGTTGYLRDLNNGDGGDRGTECDERERPHADGFAKKITVDADNAASDGGANKSKHLLRESERHGCPPFAVVILADDIAKSDVPSSPARSGSYSGFVELAFHCTGRSE